MANLGHELGMAAGICCLVGDILKTLLPVLAMARMNPQLAWPVVCAWTGLGATLGHDFPFWHGFRGGKGVTTIASTIILMNPLWGILAGVVGVTSIVLTGYLSVAALIAMGFYVVAAFFTLPVDCVAVSLVFQALQVKAHWSKLVGIHQGTTRRASMSVRFWEKVRSERR